MFIKKSEKYLSVEEAAFILGKSIGQINLYVWLHILRDVEKVGDCYIIPKDEVFRLQGNNSTMEAKMEDRKSYEETIEDSSSFSY
ncbi:MAG: hypothetical protein HF314_11335 [Ignavibacteria bacterium]|jgi:hypothetical protein|nr:hypothetical protein [Ignavibacteria bacterium]MCU7503661.1 hypothetical protein [Ignavibacteria bacterium]MCU7517856.1 hypothetical protein [Ignavibacteria bacterium]